MHIAYLTFYKTLVLRGDKTGVFVCVIPGGEELDLKKMPHRYLGIKMLRWFK
jgi:prolyl-tRNA editing enzyme YbaK/EbsC (Cys-tRNA(Pro) deacylase)